VKAFYGVIYPGQVSPVPAWILTAGLVRTMIYMLAGIAILAASYVRFLDISEKRRVRVLMLGIAIHVLASIVLVWADTFSGRTTTWGGAVLWPLFFTNLLWPVAMARHPAPSCSGYRRHHPAGTAICVRARRRYRIRPREQAPPHLTSENKVVALLHVLGKPLELLLGDSE
jgi:hypothetical protein